MKKRFLFIFTCFVFIFISKTFSQVQISGQPHTGRIECIQSINNEYFTSGNDGFLIHWDNEGNGEHFQVSDLEIKMFALHPNGTDVAVYETDGFSVHRISVWNWKTQTRKFAKRFTDSIVSLSYSAKGTYILAGTSSVDGLLFLNSTTGTPLSVVKEFTGLVSLAQTGANENSVILYSPQGTLTYYKISDGSKKASFDCLSSLEQVQLMHNNVYLVGSKQNSINIVQATSGKTVASIDAINPIIVQSTDSDIFYIEKDTENYCYVLKQIPLRKSDLQFIPMIIKSFTFDEEIDIDNAVYLSQQVFFGLENGSLYSINTNPSSDVEEVEKITEEINNKISDIVILDNKYYFVSDSSLFSGTMLSTDIELLLEKIDATNILLNNNSLILWSKNETTPIFNFDLANNTLTQLFTPDKPITSISVSENTLVIISGNSTINICDLTNATSEQIYSGTGLQDAVLYDNQTLYVSKTSVTNPKSSLITININTKETAPLPVTGEVIFSLVSQQKGTQKLLYGISIELKDSKKKTEVFSYSPTEKKYTALLQLADEDTLAFVNFINDTLYTNIGKNSIRSLNLTTKKSIQFKRAASLPNKIVGNSNYFAVLNKDGSITWYNATTNQKLENWYFTSDNYLLSL